jgi:hypothetical protein
VGSQVPVGSGPVPRPRPTVRPQSSPRTGTQAQRRVSRAEARAAASREEAGALVAGVSEHSLAWLRDVDLPVLSPVPTMKHVPAQATEYLSRCYLLNLGLQQSGNRDHAVAGRKLQVLLPRMILRTLSMRSTQKAAVEMRRRCTRYLDGDWQALIAECPAPIGVAV